jgi:hypothetical protein
MRFEMRFDGLEINRTRGFYCSGGGFCGRSFFYSFIRFDWVGVWGLGLGWGEIPLCEWTDWMVYVWTDDKNGWDE